MSAVRADAQARSAAMSVAAGRMCRMTSATADDYAWIRSSPLFGYALECGYTLTLVRGVTPGRCCA